MPDIDYSLSPQELSSVARAHGLALSMTNVTQLPKLRLKGVEEVSQEIADLLAPLLPDVTEPGCDES